MSIFDELVILIDDLTEVKQEKIEELLPKYSRQILGSSLGRLQSRGWITQTSQNGSAMYRITERGNQYVNNVLQSIRRSEEEWNGTWFCVLTIMPTENRRERDMLRRYLVSQGFGMVVDGLWMSPWNRQDDIAQVVKKLGVGSSVITFETQQIEQGTLQVLRDHAWDWQKIQANLEAFIQVAEVEARAIAELAKLATEGIPKTRLRIQAKCFVFNYGLLLASDPNLPKQIISENNLRTRAHTLYQEVRQYCYN